MNLHRNARLTPRGRRLLVERVCDGQVPLAIAAEAAGISERTACKWVARYRREGVAGLEDRSSAAHRVPGRTSEDRVAAIAALRRLRMTAAEISELLEMPLSTVSAVLLRIGLGKRSRLEPLEPANRYQRERPGELVHIDVKKLGRIDRVGHRITGRRASQHARGLWHDGKRLVGWDYVHVCVDDATRLAYVEVLPDETLWPPRSVGSALQGAGLGYSHDLCMTGPDRGPRDPQGPSLSERRPARSARDQWRGHRIHARGERDLLPVALYLNR